MKKIIALFFMSIAGISAQPSIYSIVLTSQNSSTPGVVKVNATAGATQCTFFGLSAAPAATIQVQCFTGNGFQTQDQISVALPNSLKLFETGFNPAIFLTFSPLPTGSLPVTCQGAASPNRLLATIVAMTTPTSSAFWSGCF